MRTGSGETSSRRSGLSKTLGETYSNNGAAGQAAWKWRPTAEVIPHGWKTGITSAVGRHFQAACPAAPLFEYVSPKVFDSPLRRELVSPEPIVKDGYMELPTAPGLGIELNEELVERWRIDR